MGVGPLAQGRDVITADVAEAKHNQDTVASSSPAIQNTPAAATSFNRDGLQEPRDDRDTTGRGGDREPVREVNLIARWFRSMFAQVWRGDEPDDRLADSGRSDHDAEQRHCPDRLHVDVAGHNDTSGCFDEERAAPGEENIEVAANTVPITPLTMWLRDRSAF